MTKKSQNVERQCAGCRETDQASLLERFVAIEDEDGHLVMIHDPFQKMPGRGTYLHLDQTCLQIGLKGGLKRSLKKAVVVPSKISGLASTLLESIQRRFLETIRASFRSNEAYLYEVGVEKGFATNRLTLLLIANDAGESTKKKYRLNANRKDVEVEETRFSRQELAQLVGKDSVSLIGFGGNLSKRLQLDLEKLVKLEKIMEME